MGVQRPYDAFVDSRRFDRAVFQVDQLSLVLGFVALTWPVIVGTSNAVNLTDGGDGLVIMPAVMVEALWACLLILCFFLIFPGLPS